MLERMRVDGFQCVQTAISLHLRKWLLTVTLFLFLVSAPHGVHQGVRNPRSAQGQGSGNLSVDSWETVPP